MGSLLREEDRIPFTLVYSIYTNLLIDYEGYKYGGGDDRVKYWINGTSAIVGCRGTSVGYKKGHLDLLDDVKLSLGAGCRLSITQSGKKVMDQLQGYDIIVCGHSLGGTAAFCLAKEYGCRGISFNGAAPIVGGAFTGTQMCTAYHIVGDIISTHIDGYTCTVYRYKIGGEVNWGDPGYYHSSERFFGNEGVLWSAQQEQDDMQRYVFDSTVGKYLIPLISGVVTKNFSGNKIRELVCKNPIPGSKSGDKCGKQRDLSIFAGQILGLLLGYNTAPSIVTSLGSGILSHQRKRIRV